MVTQTTADDFITLDVTEYDLSADAFVVKLSTRDEAVTIPAELLPKLCGHYDEPDEFVGKSFMIAKLFDL